MNPHIGERLLLLVLCLFISSSNVAATPAWQNPETVDYNLKIHLVDAMEWRKLQPKSLKVQFDKTQISGKMTFSLLGYSERNATKISKVHLPFSMLASKELPETQVGELDVLKLQLKCSAKDEECNLYEMGFMQISGEMAADLGHVATLVSPVIPLGWFIQPLFKKAGFTNWAFGKCRTWYKAEPAEISTAIANVSCPTELAVARSDPGWFLLSNYLAGVPAGNKPQPSQECFYSAIEEVPANMHAAPASLCCYRTSDSGLLQKEFVTIEKPLLHGSSVLRSHPFGSDYHKEHYLPGHVPYLSHWYWDIMPHIYCCIWWTGNACVNMYMKLRPAPQMKRKEPGSQAGYVYGSTVRLLGANPPPSAFCTKPGEYWLVRSPAIEVQIRYYVVSEYIGPKDVPKPTLYSYFRPSGSRSVLVTALAIRSMEMPHRIVEIICPEGEYRAYIQVSDIHAGTSATYELRMGGGVGTKLVVSESLFTDGNRVLSVLARHAAGRVGITAYIAHPGEEFFNLYVTVSGGLMAQSTGLIKDGGHCTVNKIRKHIDRLFTTSCEFCDDLNKYAEGRPLYFEDYNGPEHLRLTVSVDPRCKNDTTCQYMMWSTNYMEYFKSSLKAKTLHIDKLLPNVNKQGFPVCQRPNITGLDVLETQRFTVSSTMPLNCLKPFSASASKVVAECRQGPKGPAFTVPKDFICAQSPKFVEVEKAAAKADEQYTKDHYTPKESKGASSTKSIPPLSEILLSILGRWIQFKIYNKIV
ncbi:hypothetical protein BOX15_Mlig031757g1 [Macrostomum lignano]|uniref:AMOP domain-containing protein n=1 Tax=Macrostomum lignano TaxID=282301 RepID=A0A267H852_9PLAT|nr:hypothetical protein BOX15_Mlig031757g1 [Macrostomum lignano]